MVHRTEAWAVVASVRGTHLPVIIEKNLSTSKSYRSIIHYKKQMANELIIRHLLSFL
jgi:hypothetical protein